MGDVWYGGTTRNPWNLMQGSSGSSAGPASAVSAGCLPFAIGSETLGSISSPSTRCGVTGYRPSFGFVPRTGAMPLSWSMDKLGPIARSVEDCALVMSHIFGPDGVDHSVHEASFVWDAKYDWRKLRIGYFTDTFAEPTWKAPERKKDESDADFAKRTAASQASFARRLYDAKYDRATLDVLKRMGITLIPVELPKLPWGAMVSPLEAEGAASFDQLTLSGRDALLNGQSAHDWPNLFRAARFYPAVDYVQAMRARSLGIAAMKKLFDQVDIVAATSSSTQLTATNLTGHPAIIVPNGLRGADAPAPRSLQETNDGNTGGPGTPVSITFLAGLYNDARLLAFANAYQQAAGFLGLHPKL
ncbi:amidase family protein [Granulicella cerasi]|uniref:Amidase family protein n=3 Tax=Granulicella cerasi TaxID=741063 RepID=A0ABW1Z7B1_9BACT